MQASFLSSSWRYCSHNNGIIALDLQRRCCPCSDGIVDVFKLAPLPSLQWRCHCHCCHCPCCSLSSWCHCHRCAGIFVLVMMAIVALVTMALSPLSMRRRLCHCGASVIALVACCQAGIVALITIVLFPSMHLHLCCCRDCNCRPCDDGASLLVVDAQASLLPLLRWCCCPRNNGIVAIDLQWHCCPCCPCCDGVVTILKLVLLLLLQWRCHHH